MGRWTLTEALWARGSEVELGLRGGGHRGRGAVGRRTRVWGYEEMGTGCCGEVNKRLRGQSWVCGEVGVGAEGSLPLSQLSKT